FHVAGVRGGAVHRLRGQGGTAPGQVGQRRVLQVGQAGAERLVGQEQVPQAAPFRLRLQLVDDRRPVPRVGQRRNLVREDRFGGVHALVEEGLDATDVLGRDGVGREVHRGAPIRVRCARGPTVPV